MVGDHYPPLLNEGGQLRVFVHFLAVIVVVVHRIQVVDHVLSSPVRETNNGGGAAIKTDIIFIIISNIECYYNSGRGMVYIYNYVIYN